MNGYVADLQEPREKNEGSNHGGGLRKQGAITGLGEGPKTVAPKKT